MREKPDHYSIQAKKEGYPARSVYKLKEINERFKLIKKGHKILDLGASPGSWSLYTLKCLKDSGALYAVDLKVLNLNKTFKNLFFYKGDVFSDEICAIFTEKGPFHLLLSDAAPATTGNRTVDTGRSFTLSEQIINLSEKHLIQSGNMVIKIFQGGDEKQLIDHMKQYFNSVKSFKPKACRKASFETYLIGLDKK